MPLDQVKSGIRLDWFADFAPEMRPCVESLRERGLCLTDLQDFPSDQIDRLVQLERQTELDRTRPLEYYVALAYGCLTSAFIMTQRHAAIRRIETSDHPRVGAWLHEIRSGGAFATVGISHLTTSRQHLTIPPVTLRWEGDRGSLRGSIPWVTGGAYAKYLVAGAVDEASPEKQYLIMLELPSTGVRPGPGMPLVALTNSCTDVVDLDQAWVDRKDVLHGPHENVMAASNTGGAGGFQTSALAIGLAARAIEYLEHESRNRPSLRDHAANLERQWTGLYETLISGKPDLDPVQLRKGANDLALHSTHAALSAAKGAGFVDGHPVGRWCREALFFLVWSCPQSVSDAHLCTFSGWQA